MIDTVQQKQEAIQSIISYGSGGSLLGFAALADVAQQAQAWALILGCAVVAVRLIHDVIKLYRYIKEED